VDPRILIATLLLSLGLAAETPPPSPIPGSGSTDSVSLSVAGVSAAKSERAPVLEDSTPAWEIPGRDGAPGGAFREAFRGGDPSASWSRVFEFDGMYETWTPWPSLAMAERAERLSWTGPSLAGASDAAPSQVVSVARSTEIGFGGERVRRLLALHSPQDTPSTRLQFFRGPLASYRFGLDFSRAVAGPWGLALRMGTRSAQGRSWSYRDQIQDLFQGSFGRTREELPGQGRSPGQDDVQWETVLSRATPASLFEFGWTWVDLRRGIPDPRNAWGDSGYAPFPGKEARSGVFGRILSQAGGFKGSVSGRWVGQDWTRAGWFGGDSTPPLQVAGATDHQELEGEVWWARAPVQVGLTARSALRTGSASGSRRVAGTFQEDQERVGAYLASGGEAIRVRGDLGFNRLNDPLNRTLTGFDGSVALDWNGGFWHSTQRLAREIRLPDWERTILPDALSRSLPSRSLATESRWFLETRHRWAVGKRWALDAALAGLAIDEAIQTAAIPVEGVVPETDRSGLVLGNAAGRVLGWSAQGGVRWDANGWWMGSQWAVGRTMAPGEGLAGSRDLRFPALHSRTSLGWQGPLLAGRARGMSSMSLATWSSSVQIAGAAEGTTAVRLPPGGQLDWENQLQIKTFALFWRLENLLNDRQTPAVGWTPPGIRSGWGVTWSFGG
jgi:hypothetical protein